MSEKLRKIIVYATVAVYLLLGFGPMGAKPYRQFLLIGCAVVLAVNSLVFLLTNKPITPSAKKQEIIWQSCMLLIVVYAVLCLVGVIPAV